MTKPTPHNQAATLKNDIAIVLCAGFAKRLRPLSQFIPKVVLPMGGTPLAWHSIRTLLDAGFSQVHCNLHHGAYFVEQELKSALKRFGYEEHRIRFWHESPQIWETGGGIARIVQSLLPSAPYASCKGVYVVSGDIWGPIPLNDMVRAWECRSPEVKALMCTLPLNTPRQDATWVQLEEKRVVGFGPHAPHVTEGGLHPTPCPRLFSNHQVIDPSLIKDVPLKPESSVTLFFKRCLSNGYAIEHLDYPYPNAWHNVGTFEELFDCLETQKKDALQADPLQHLNDSPLVFTSPQDSILFYKLPKPYPFTEPNAYIDSVFTCPAFRGSFLEHSLLDLFYSPKTQSKHHNHIFSTDPLQRIQSLPAFPYSTQSNSNLFGSRTLYLKLPGLGLRPMSSSQLNPIVTLAEYQNLNHPSHTVPPVPFSTVICSLEFLYPFADSQTHSQTLSQLTDSQAQLLRSVFLMVPLYGSQN